MKIAMVFLAVATQFTSGVASAGGNSSTGLRINPENPHYFVYNGKPFYLLGSGMESHCREWSRTRQRWYSYLDMLHRNGFNRVRFFPWDFCWQEELLPWFSPWWVLDPRNFNFDLKHFNEKYWSFVKDIIAYGEKRGIVFEYVLFDYCSLRPPEWTKNPFAAENGGAVPGKIGKPGIFAFSDYANLDLFRQPFDNDWPWQKRNQWFQQLYVKRTLDELSSFPNIYWEIMNELGYGRIVPHGLDWTRHWLRFLDKHDPARHLRSINANDVYDALSGIDIVCEHPIPFFNRKWKGPEEVVQLIHKNLHFNKPVVCDETGFYPPPKSTKGPIWRTYTPIQLANERRAFWYAFVAGGHWTAACWQDFRERDTHRWVRHLADFIRQVPYWKMHPHDELVKGGHCLAQPGEQYVIYTGYGGEIVVDLSALQGKAFQAVWVDPRTGQQTMAKGEGELNTYTFRTPSSDDWALWIFTQ